MPKILVFGASNSSTSINQKLAFWAADQISDAQIVRVDLNDYEMPIYGIDRERSDGIPSKAVAFKQLIADADGIIISYAEHNGNYATAYKNILDWVSRVGGKIWLDTPVLALAASPGGRGAKTVLGIAETALPYQGAQLTGVFSLPFFKDNFDTERGILDASFASEFQMQLTAFEQSIGAAVI